MKVGKIPVVKVGQSGVTGSVEDFENHFERRRKGSGKPSGMRPQSKLQPIKNVNMQERVEELGLGESQ